MSKRKHEKPRRVDYWHDPDAPKPTSRKPSASVIVRNSAGDLLLLRRPDSGRARGSGFEQEGSQLQWSVLPCAGPGYS